MSQLRTLTFEGISTPPKLGQQERLSKELKVAQSFLWSGHKYRQLGTNKPETGTSQSLWDTVVPDERPFGIVENNTKQNTHLPRNVKQSISRWAGEIEPATTVDVVERPLDVGSARLGKQRLVKDSDDESSDDSELQTQAASPAPNGLSYSGPRKAGKRRIPKDSDDEPEESSYITREAFKQVASKDTNSDPRHFERDNAQEQRQIHVKSMSRYDSDVMSNTNAIREPHSRAAMLNDDTQSPPSSNSAAKPQTFLSGESPEKHPTLSMIADFTNGFDPSKYSANGQTSRKPSSGSETVLVGNLTFTTSIPRIAEVFSDHGTIRNIRHEPEKGKVYITMSSPMQAQRTAKYKDGIMLEGRKIYVKLLESQTHFGSSSLPRTDHKELHNELRSKPSTETYRDSHTLNTDSPGSLEDEHRGKPKAQRDLGNAKAVASPATLQTRVARRFQPYDRERSLINTGNKDDMTSTNNKFLDYAKDGLLPLPAESTLDSTITEAQTQESPNPTPPLPLAPLTTSRTSRSPSPQPSRGSDLYVSTKLPGIDMAHVKKEKIRSLKALVAKQAEMKEASQNPSSQESPTTSSRSSEQLQARDEVSSRKFYNTMAQKAGKRKQLQSKAKSNQKRQTVLAETWPSPYRQPTKPTSQDKIPRSPEATQITKPSDFQNGSGEHLNVSANNIAVATRLSAELAPIFNPLRAFTGQLAFKVELGQVLISGSKSNAIGNNCPRELNEWDTVFNPPHGKNAPATTFANHLTTNGKDVDHLLCLPYPRATLNYDDRRTNKDGIFDPDPEDRATSYEFHCQSKDNENFILTLAEAGDFHVRRPFQPLGFVNLHYIGQVWDARAVIDGSEPFEVSSSLKKAIIDLRSSVYIPEGRTQLEMSYKQPTGNEIRIQKIFCVRTTLHQCLKFPDIIVETVLVQDLILQVRADNPEICRAFERSYGEMVESDQLRWKVSLLSRNITAALKENERLILGDTVESWTAPSLLFETSDNKQQASATMREIVALADSVVKQIDGMGYHNFGSLCRYADAHGGVSYLGSLVYNDASSDMLVSPEGPLGHQDGGKKDPTHRVRAQDAIRPDDSASQAGGGRPPGYEGWRFTHQQGCGAKVAVPTGEFW